MQKPVNLCDELACMREWTVVVTQYGQPTLSPAGSTGMNMKLCDLCAKKHEQRQAAIARA